MLSCVGVKKYVSRPGILLGPRIDGRNEVGRREKKTERNVYAPCLDPVVAERDIVTEPVTQSCSRLLPDDPKSQKALLCATSAGRRITVGVQELSAFGTCR